jgi:hypothetical protein
VRRLLPQVNADVLLPRAAASGGDAAPTCFPALATPHAWWGWCVLTLSLCPGRRPVSSARLTPIRCVHRTPSRRFQFHTAAYAPHAARLVALFTLRADVLRALDAAVALARDSGGGGAATPLLGVHVRGGEGFTPLPPAGGDVDDADESNTAAAPPAALVSAPAEAEPPAASPAASPTASAEAWAPPAEGGLASCCTTGAWRDTGVFWAAPLEWCGAGTAA